MSQSFGQLPLAFTGIDTLYHTINTKDTAIFLVMTRNLQAGRRHHYNNNHNYDLPNQPNVLDKKRLKLIFASNIITFLFEQV